MASRPLGARRGDQLRATQICDALAAEAAVTVLEPGVGWRPPRVLESATALLRAALTGAPLQPALVASRDLLRRVEQLAPAHDLVVVLLARLAAAAEVAARTTPVVVDLVDSLSLNAQTRAAVSGAGSRWLWRREAGALECLEQRVVATASSTVLVCERDRLRVANGVAAEHARRVLMVPLAVSASTIPAVAAPRRIVLTGNLGYYVNRNAVLGFLSEVWPQLRARGFELVVAGDRPGWWLRRTVLQAGAQLIQAPADLLSVVRSAVVAVAPTRCGAGVPVKVLEAWACGVPVVVSPFAAAGAGLVSGEQGLVADSPEQWVAAIEAIANDPSLSARLVAGGADRLARVHAPDQVAQQWREVARAAII